MPNVEQQLEDADTLQLSISSSWRSKGLAATDASIQTARVQLQDQACQSKDVHSKFTQTDRLFKKYSDAVRGGPGLRPLVTFLERVVPLVEGAILENRSAHTEIDWTPEAPCDAAFLHILQAPDLSTDTPEHALCCTSVSWSSTGQGIAVSYGRFDVEGWCLQPGKLCTWNLARPGFDGTKPDIIVEVDSCLQCCAFHPQQPGLIAGGTYMGEVYVWDLAQEGDYQVFKSTISASSHQEPVTAISWHIGSASDPLLGNTEESDLLVSLGSDGRLLMWNWHTTELLYGFELMWQQPDTRKLVLWGGTCMALPGQSCHAQSGGCLVGTEGGAVFRCSLDGSRSSLQAFAQAVQAQQKALVSSPIRSLVCRHAGPVHAVTASPFDPGLVISAGLDGQVRVCSSLARQPLLELTPSDSYLFSAQWSPHRPMLFAIGAGDGRVLLYDLTRDTEHPVKTLDVCGVSAPVFDLAFNVRAPELFATTDQQCVKVSSEWRPL
ncbi:WD repeat-containing protein 34 [Trebouxia sp. C0009 RCD-2024]